MSGRQRFKTYEPLINMFVKCVSILPRFLRWRLFVMFRYVEGNLGFVLRYVLFKTMARECGSNVSIYPGAYIYDPQGMIVGDNVSIHEMSFIWGRQVTIGSNVSISHGCSILSVEHNYSDPSVPMKYQGVVCKETLIGSDVIVGAKTTILCGCSIGNGTFVGAGAVVTKSLPDNVIAVGVPAKVIRNRIELSEEE